MSQLDRDMTFELTFDIQLDSPADSGRVTVARNTQIAASLALLNFVQLQNWPIHSAH